jgi:hypothetical protein
MAFRKLKLKQAAPDAPDVPDFGSTRPTPIRYGTPKGDMSKMDINDVEIDFGVDSKASRAQVSERRVPKSDYGLASQMVPEVEDLEPAARKHMGRQNVRLDAGTGPAQIKIKAFNSGRGKKKILTASSFDLGDTTTRPIEGPKPVATKVGRETQHVELIDTRTVSTIEPFVNPLRDKPHATPVMSRVETYVDQSVETPHNPLRVKKVTQPMSFATSSGFQTEFNPAMPSHRAKLKKALNTYKVVIEQDPDVTVALFAKLNFKGKPSAPSGAIPQPRDEHHTEVDNRSRGGHRKKVIQTSQRVDTFEQVEVHKAERTKDKRRTTAQPHRAEDGDNVEVEDQKAQTRRKKTTQKVSVEDTDRETVEVHEAPAKSKTKTTSEMATDVPEDGQYIPIGPLKAASRGKKISRRMGIQVPPYEGNVTISAAPPDLNQKKGKSDITGLEPGVDGTEVHVETRTAEAKKVKNPEQMEVQLTPFDRETDDHIDEPTPKVRPAKPQAPQLEPSKDDQDVEIEKSKNVFIFA